MALPNAQDIPALLGPIGYNAMYLPDLVRQCQRGGIVPFVGAGLSAPFGFPQWSAFLLSTVKTDALRAAVQAKLDGLEYAEAASLVRERLGRRLFDDLLRSTFGDDHIPAGPITGAVARLAEFPVGPLVTTNFDRLIETVFARAKKPLRAVWHAQAVKGAEALQRNEAFLLKLHGDWQDGDNRVLTLEEYTAAYGDERVDHVDNQRPVPQLLNILLPSRSCLFLGCSLKQDRTMRMLKAIADTYNTKHYALLARPADDGEFEARQKELSDALGIAPIWYPAGQHELLDPLLQYLVAKSAAPTPRVAVDASARREPPNNIPSPPNATVGRSEEIRHVIDMMRGARLVTVQGGGGCGKSRVAMEVARETQYQYAEGAWWIDLTDLSGKADRENLLPARIGTIAGVPQQPSRPPLEGLIERFSKGRHLLVLDNCEHLVRSCEALLKELLTHCAGVHVLATSRVPLKLADERIFPLATLQPPDPDASFEGIRQNEAVQLFQARAGRGFEVTAENAAAVADLCRALDGIPLAIEVAAARLGVRSVQQLNKQSRALLDALHGVEVDDLRHWKTVNAALDWSYKLLTKPLRDFVRPLALFDGGWTEEWATRIHAGATHPPDTAKFLQKLLDHSIVLSRVAGDTTRFRFLEPVRQFMRAKLTEQEAARAGRAHASIFTDLAEQASPELLKADQQKWLADLQIEADNLRAALRWSIEHGDTRSALRMTASIWRFLEIRGYFTEGRERTAEVLAMSGTGDFPDLLEKTLSGAGWLAYRQADFPAAAALVERALVLAEQLDLPAEVANALNDLGQIAAIRGEYAVAEAHMARGLAIQRGLGGTRLVAVLLNNLGAVAMDTGDLMEASMRLAESLDLFREAGNKREVAFPLRSLAQLALYRGDLNLARDYAQESLDLRVALKDSKGQADTLCTCAWIEGEDGKVAEGAALLEKSLAFAKAIGDRRTISEALEVGALLHWRSGAACTAAQLLAGAASLRRRIGFAVPPVKATRFDAIVAGASAQLGDAEYQACCQRGESRDVNALMEVASRPAGPR